MKKHKPKTIEEAIDSLQNFLESDMWYCVEEEFKCEQDLVNYLREHFKILRKEVKRLKK